MKRSRSRAARSRPGAGRERPPERGAKIRAALLTRTEARAKNTRRELQQKQDREQKIASTRRTLPRAKDQTEIRSPRRAGRSGDKENQALERACSRGSKRQRGKYSGRTNKNRSRGSGPHEPRRTGIRTTTEARPKKQRTRKIEATPRKAHTNDWSRRKI
jgi:hypothetical protein